MTALGDLVDMTFGFAFKSADFTTSPDDVMLLRGDNVAQGRLRWDGVKRFPAGRLGEVEQYRLAVGDIVIAMDRPWIEAGLKWSVVRQTDVPALLVQRVARLRARPGLDQGFLAAVVASRAFTDYVIGVQTGSAVPHISGGQIAGYEVQLPPLGEQRTIAATLSALDDKIESSRQAISIGESLGDALFVGASDGLARLGDVAELTMGSSPPGVSYNEVGEGLPFYQGVRDFGRRYPGYRVWTTAPVRTAGPNDTLISVRAPVGSLNRSRETCCIGRGVAAAHSRRPSALYYALRAASEVWEPFQHEGTVFGSINRSDLAAAQVPWSSRIASLDEELRAIDERIESLSAEIEKLEEVRDVLLPALLSGRIRVPVAQEAVA